MSLLTKLKYLLPSRRRAEERDMREELESLREIAGAGELGNLTLAAEKARETWTWMWLERLGQDLRYSLRSMLHNKGFTVLAALSLALGIGANTAIYSFMESILLRALPVPEPESLVVMKWRANKYTSAAARGFSFSTRGTHVASGEGTIGTQFPYPALEVFRRNTDVLSSAFCYFVDERFTITINNESESVNGQYVSGDYFRGMGLPPAAGRLILASDDEIQNAMVAVLSHRLAQRRFGTVGGAVGQTIRVNNRPLQVIGIAPPGFFGGEPGSIPDVYVPMHARQQLQPSVIASSIAQELLDPHYYWIEIMGRLKPGVTVARAQAVLGPQFRRFVEESATTEPQRADLPELRIVEGAAGLDSLRRRYAKPVYVLMGMVGVILLIACANVANLLLSRAAARRREIAVRLSIGASRSRVIRQLLTESVVLSSLGGALGLAFAWWGIRLLTVMLASGRENFTLHAELNAHVLVATLVLSVLTGLLFGLVPAIQATRVDVITALKDVRAGAAGGTIRPGWGRIGVSQALVVAQIALSLVLLVAAGLFGRTLSNLHAIELGFGRDNVLLFTLRPRASGYEGAAAIRLYEDVRHRLRELPGVRAVSLSSRALPAGGGTTTWVTPAGASIPSSTAAADLRANAGLFTVGPSFFETMQIPLNAGREFDERDTSAAGSKVIVNQRLARSLRLPNPLGTRIDVGGTTYEIVGVVGDALFLFLKEDLRPMVYFPYQQGTRPPPQMTYEVRTSANAGTLADSVRQVVRQIDSRLAVSDMKTQAAHIDQAINQEIALARLCIGFAVLALVIACVGLYGIVAFNVTRRTAEIGIRMALGAQRAGIIWLVLRSVLILELLGLAVGVPVVLAGSKYVESLLYGIKPNDPLAVTGAVVILFAAGLAASYLPARRASGIDPMLAVRHE